MTSKETEILRKNITDQLDRLVQQLAELEEYRAELDDAEYAEMKKDTHEQLAEFAQKLERLSSGDLTLLDEISAMKMALQATISEAFRTPEVIALFARKQPAMLRLKLQELERDHKIQRITGQMYIDRKVEILTALSKLGDELTDDEKQFIHRNTNELLANFHLASSEFKSTSDVLAVAAASNKSR